MSTAKILFVSFITFCILGMLLLFSMQKSAQLSLDMGNMELISKEKENKYTSVNDALQSAEATIEQIKNENARIPQLEHDIKTIEQEKLVYVQQLDDFQNELQNQEDTNKQHLIKISTLQKQQDSDQQSLVALQSQATELTTALEVALTDLEEKTLKIDIFTDTLSKKDRVIQIYKEKLDKAAEDIVLLETSDSNEQLNLVLILDELAQKTALAKDLENKLITANNEAIAAGIDSSTIISVNTENQTLVDKLTLENDYLTTGMKELSATIKVLETKKAAMDELVASLTSEIEQLELLVTDKDKALAALQHDVDKYAQQINQLSVTISAREDEVLAVKKQAQGIAAPLTEKITGLELQVTQAANQFAGLTDELSESQSGLNSIEEEKQLIVDELRSTKIALESIQNQLGETEKNQTALQESISMLEQQLAAKDESIETITVALTTATALATDNETFAAGLNEQLTTAKNEIISRNAEQEELISRLIGEVADAKAAATELLEQTTGLQARNEELLAALTTKEKEIETVEDIALEAVIEVEKITETEGTSVEPEAEPIPEPEDVEIIVIDEVTETIATPEAVTEPLDIEIVDEQATLEEPVEELPVVEEVEAQTNQATEEIPLQDDSANAENL